MNGWQRPKGVRNVGNRLLQVAIRGSGFDTGRGRALPTTAAIERSGDSGAYIHKETLYSGGVNDT